MRGEVASMERLKEERKEKRWYALHVMTGQEEMVSRTIDRVVRARGLGDKISRVLVPTHEVPRYRKKKRVMVKERVFKGYVFVEVELDPETWHLIRSIPGVTGFVGGDEPVPLSQEEVDSLLIRVGEMAPRLRPAFLAGDTVRVISGPFSEHIGKVQEVYLPRERVKVLISLFGRETPVELEFSQVEKIQ